MRRIRSRKRQGGTKRGLSVEGLETRRLLVGDVFVVGDSDNDGAFGSGDLVQAFQEGKFETGEEATFEQGDWNDDGVFDSSDLVFAFESGTYGVPQPLAADDGTPDGEDDGDPNGNEVEPPVDNGTINGNDEDGDQPRHDHDGDHPWGHHFDRGDRSHPHKMAGRFFDSMIGKLEDGIESGDLPGHMTEEQAKAMIRKLSEAREVGDFGGIRELVGQWMTERKHRHQEEHADRMKGHAEKMGERLTVMLDALQQRIDSGHHPAGMSPEDAHAFIDGIHAKLQEGEIHEALGLMKGLRGPWHRQRSDNDEHPEPGDKNPDNGEIPDRGEEPDGVEHPNNGRHDRGKHVDVRARMLGVAIDKMQDAIDSGRLPDEAQKILDAARSALDEGDAGGAVKYLSELRHLGHDGPKRHDEQRDHDHDDPDHGDPDHDNPDRDAEVGDPNGGPTDGPNDGDADDLDERPDHGRWQPEHRDGGRWSLEKMKAAFERFRKGRG